MSVAKKFLESLLSFSKIPLKSSTNSTRATHEFGNFLLATFELGKTNTQLSNEDYKITIELLSNTQQDIKHCLGNLVDDFFHDNIVTFLIYRSGIELLFSIVEGTDLVADTKICLKSSEIVDIIEEFDDKISRYWTAPADPSGATPSAINLQGIPHSHTWWRFLRLDRQ